MACDRPLIVCLCGSTRFWRTFQQASLQETLAGKIVLSIGAASGTDDEHFGNLPRAEYDRVKQMLDELHLRKIDLADEVLILNVDGYIGESTARELAYARDRGKTVRFWEEIRTCRVCGCTDDHACEGGCWWVDRDLCSSCALTAEVVL